MLTIRQAVWSAVVVMAVAPVPGWSQAKPQPAAAASRTLTYVANAGVLVTVGETKILIDALFELTRPNPLYRSPSPETIERMVNGTAPFDGVTLALVTHSDRDHFDPRVALRFLEGRREATLVAPADAVAAMRAAAADWSRVEGRVITVEGQAGTRAVRQVRGVSVTTLRTRHGSSETPPNVMYLVEANGWRLFHEGDSPGDVDEYRRFGLDKERIDLALIHFWFPFDATMATFLKDAMRPAHIALTHLPIEGEGKYPARIAALGQTFGDLFLLLPGMPTRVLQQ